MKLIKYSIFLFQIDYFTMALKKSNRRNKMHLHRDNFNQYLDWIWSNEIFTDYRRYLQYYELVKLLVKWLPYRYQFVGFLNDQAYSERLRMAPARVKRLANFQNFVLQFAKVNEKLISN